MRPFKKTRTTGVKTEAVLHVLSVVKIIQSVEVP